MPSRKPILGVLAVGLGALLRDTGGIASFVGLLCVLPGVVAPLPSSTADAVNSYLPLTPASPSPTSTFENSPPPGSLGRIRGSSRAVP
jgi:hypothetical protein